MAGRKEKLLATIPTVRFVRRHVDGYNWYPGPTMTRVITLVRHFPNEPGQLSMDKNGEWILGCPNCGKGQWLDHDVVILMDRITINPSVWCGYDCGFHEVITGWEYRKGISDAS